MATRYQQELLRNKGQLERLAKAKPFIWLHRPRWEHTESPNRKECPCCGSRHARRIADEPYLDLLVHRRTGRRTLFDPKDAKWRPFLDRAERYNIPFRCHHEQRRVAETKAKLLLVSGGVRAGKSAVGADAIADEVMRHGGPGVSIWWVAPELKHLETAIEKLFTGTTHGEEQRFEPPVFPPDFVLRHPTDPNQRNLKAFLRDGTQIRLWHAGNAGQFKGRAPRLVIFDEGAEINNDDVLSQLRERTLSSNGRILIPTTPKIPSTVKQIRDEGMSLPEWEEAGRPYAAKVWHQFTSFHNPWIPNEYIENHVALEMRGDQTRVRREIHGEWIGDGTQLWSQFDPKTHLRGGDWETVEDLGLINVTHLAARDIFTGSSADQLRRVGGQDFNLNPMSTTIHQVGVPYGLAEDDPANWIYVTTDEVVERHDLFEHCDTLQQRGYAGLHILCDPDGAQTKDRVGYGKSVNLALEMEAKGFTVEPCHRSYNGNPVHPPQRDRHMLARKLMAHSVTDPEGNVWPRSITHTRCTKVIKAYEGQEDKGDGTPKKESNTAADRLAGPTDAKTYAEWALANLHEHATVAKWG